MNYRIKKSIVYISLTMFLITLLGCKKSNNVVEKIIPNNTNVNNPIKLSVVIPEYNADYSAGLKDFKAHIRRGLPEDEVTVTTIKGDMDAYDTKLRILQSTNDVPDVIYSSGTKHIEQLLEDGKVAPIEKYLDKIEFWNAVIPSAKVKGYKDHIYAVPFDDVSYEIIQYNSEIFNENNLTVPTTFYELKRVIEILKTKDIIPIAVGCKDGYPVAMMMEGFAYTVDPQITANIVNDKAEFSDDPFKMAASKVKELMELNAFEKDAQNTSDADAAQLYYDGKAAMYCSSSENFKLGNEKLNGNSNIMCYPVLNISDKDNYGKACAGGVKPDCGLVISNASKYQLDAVKLAVEMSKFYSKYLYEQKNNPAIIYNETGIKLKTNDKIPLTLTKFMNNVKVFKTSTGFIQDVMANEEAVKIVNDSSKAFMCGYINVDSYLKEMDTAIDEE